MPWSVEDVDRIGRAEEVRVSSYRADGSLRRWTPIWVVRAADELYVRSARGRDADWYRHATSGRARVQAGGAEFDVRLEPADDAAMDESVDAAYRAKYGSQPSSLSIMLAPASVETTVRVLLADD